MRSTPSHPRRQGVCCFNDTATTEIYTLSLHDALPISPDRLEGERLEAPGAEGVVIVEAAFGVDMDSVAGLARMLVEDRKSTRLNSSHANISYAVFCLKKKNHHPPDPRAA